MARALELRRGGTGDVAHCGGKGNERGGHVEVLEGAAHGVLAADGANAQVDLGVEGAEHAGHGLAPTRGLVAQLFEVLLERKVGLLVLEAGGNELGKALDHGEVGALVLVGLRQVGVEAPGHAAHRGGLAEDGQLGSHGERGGELRLAAEGHEHGRRTDGGVEALGKALVGGDVEVGEDRAHALGKRGARPFLGVGAALFDAGSLMLGGTVGGEELAAHVDDGGTVPHHAHARLLGHARDGRGLEVLLGGIADEGVDVLGGQGNGHALLALGDGKLGAVEALVLLGHAVKLDEQAVGQLAHGDRHAAGAEVVAALDETAGVAAAEQALDLALDRGVALLHLGTAGLDALMVVGLGGAGGTADAVAARAATEQHDDVAGGRRLATHVVGGRGTHDGADFHTLGGIAGMVELVDLAGGKTDLVAVAGVAGGSRGHKLALGQLAGDGLAHGHRGVSGAGHAHGLVHVAAARQGVADGAAHAGGRAAEGLDLGGMVVRLVLEEVEPVLVLPVDVDLHFDGAGVDLLGLVEAREDALALEVAGADGAHVHEAHGLGVAAQLVAHVEIALVGGLHLRVVDLHVGEHGAEGGVAAVVRPVGVDHLDLGDGGVAPLRAEVLLAELDVGQVHGQAARVDEGGKAGLVEVAEALNRLHHGRLGELHMQGGRQVERSQTRLNGVHHVVLHGLDGLGGQRAGKDVHLRGTHLGTLALADELDALGSGGSALVKLTRQELHRKHRIALGGLEVGRSHVGLGLAEDGGHAGIEQLLRDALHVVAVDEAQRLQALDAQNGREFVLQLLSLDVEPRLFLHVNARNHVTLPSDRPAE